MTCPKCQSEWMKTLYYADAYGENILGCSDCMSEEELTEDMYEDDVYQDIEEEYEEEDPRIEWEIMDARARRHGIYDE